MANVIKKVNVQRVTDNGIENIEERLVNDITLSLYSGEKRLDQVVCTGNHLKELAAGTFFQNTKLLPQDIVNRLVVRDYVASFSPDNSGVDFEYFKNCSCMKNDANDLPFLTSSNLRLNNGLVLKIYKDFQDSSDVFRKTAGVHGAGLYDINGDKIFFTQDIARHNCINKITGFILHNNLDSHDIVPGVIMLSSRINSELLMMCVRAGINNVLTRGAASYSAYETADKYDVKLISFIKDERFTIIRD